MLSFREFASGLKQLDLDRTKPVIVHASLSAFGDVRGGAETILGALLLTADAIVMPAFTFNTMVIPEVGPGDNGLIYSSGRDTNRLAVPFRHDLPADKMMGILADTLRKHPNARRSDHPILSFSGINVDEALKAQTLKDPLTPIEVLMDRGGWILLLGVDHTCNTSIHYAEKIAGRRSFIRWAIIPGGKIVECPGFPGCSDGFKPAVEFLAPITREVRIGDTKVVALPIRPMVEILAQVIQEDPVALLCKNDECLRCQAVKRAVSIHRL